MLARRVIGTLALLAAVPSALVTAPPSVAAASSAGTCPPPASSVQREGPGTGKTVALTFDDGPAVSTPATLAVLMRYGVRATFFDLGERMLAHPALVRATAAQGHLVGNHTWDHPHLTTLSASDQADEIARTVAAQQQVLGAAPCVFRPPYGEYDDNTVAAATGQGMTVWNWTISTRDWAANGSASAYWVNRIVAFAQLGLQQEHPVLLLHNGPAPGDRPNPYGDPATIKALPRIIAMYRAHGYRFVDLLGRGGFTPYAPEGSPAPAVTSTASGLHVFTRGGSRRVVERTSYAGHWSAARVLGAVTTDGGIAATSPSRWTSVVAVVDRTHHVRVATVRDSGTPHWATLSGTALGRPALATDPRTAAVTLVVRRPTGALAYRRLVRGQWQPWHAISGDFATSPAVAVGPAGQLTVVAADDQGQIWVRRRDSSWTPWQQLDGTVTSAPVVAPVPGGLVLLARGVNGQLLRRTGNAAATSWQPWQRQGTRVWPSGAAAVVSAPDTLTVVATGTDGRVALARANTVGTTTTWSRWGATPVTARILP